MRLLHPVVALMMALPPLLPRLLDQGRLTLEAFLVVGLALALPRRRYRTWSAGLAALWGLLLVFEIGMALGRMLTHEEPVLYDGLQLVNHLGILLLDLYGWRFVVALGLAALGAFGVGLLAERGMALLLRTAHRPLAVLTLVGAALLAATTYEPYVTLPLAVDRTRASWMLYQRVQGLRHTDAYAPHMAVRLHRRPDVRIYVLESYGMVALRKRWGRPWTRTLLDAAEELQEKGWSLASIRSEAPTSGGRSWICDAALLSGRPIRYQAEYVALTRDTRSLDTLPAWFAQNGYETILVRPADRERPGVKLQNRFGFERTVFARDLDYRGPPFGWGKIPDRYTVGWLEDHVFTKATRPQFAFVHLTSSHSPWRVPPYRHRWQDYQELPRPKKESKQGDPTRMLWKVARQFGRSRPETRRRADRTMTRNYLATLEHGLRAILDELAGIPADRPTLVLILGDHQPPFIARRASFDVPIHIASNDPRLVESFLEEGAAEGWFPNGRLALRHAGIYPWLVRGLARYDGHTLLPPLLLNGVEL